MSNLFFYIQELPEMRVLAFHTMGPTARDDAFQLMQEWFLQQQLPDGYVPRIFGYHKKNPKTGKGDFGYEVLLSLPPDGSFTPAASVRTLEPCNYVCVTSEQLQWPFVRQYVTSTPYFVANNGAWTQSTDTWGFLNRQWLEEHHADPKAIQQFMLTGLTPFEYHHYTIMIPVTRTS
ncbi:MAG: hypothetical protein GF331_25645 [Chitinivibrionales bacterium]|nr:hypothetical protein [Chitinivibrionales bacterium]